MVKSYWLAIALTAGILAGVFVGRNSVHADEAARIPDARGDPPRAPLPRATAAAVASPPSASSAAPASHAVEPPCARPAVAAQQQASIAGRPLTTVIINAETSLVPSESQHDKLEREPRDDSWAYLREAEIDASIVLETGSGYFHKDNLECRATMCELALSARGKEQVAALKKWFEARLPRGPAKPPSANLQYDGWSLSENGDTADALIYYGKPYVNATSP